MLSSSVADKVVAVCPGGWCNKPVGLRGVTVSSRIRLSWKKQGCNNQTKENIRQTNQETIFSFFSDCLEVFVPPRCVFSPPPAPLAVLSPIPSSASLVLSGILPNEKHCSC